MTRVQFPVAELFHFVNRWLRRCLNGERAPMRCGTIGLVVEYIVAIDVTRVRFPDGACALGEPLFV